MNISDQTIQWKIEIILIILPWIVSCYLYVKNNKKYEKQNILILEDNSEYYTHNNGQLKLGNYKNINNDDLWPFKLNLKLFCNFESLTNLNFETNDSKLEIIKNGIDISNHFNVLHNYDFINIRNKGLSDDMYADINNSELLISYYDKNNNKYYLKIIIQQGKFNRALEHKCEGDKKINKIIGHNIYIKNVKK